MPSTDASGASDASADPGSGSGPGSSSEPGADRSGSRALLVLAVFWIAA